MKTHLPHPAVITKSTLIRKDMTHIASFRTSLKNALLAIVCGGALLAANGPAIAADSPAPAFSASALFNTGNADQRAGRLGPAILNYERALFLAPHDEDIVRNLDAARERAGVTPIPVPIWLKPAHWLGLNELATTASISLLLFGFVLLGARRIPAAGSLAACIGSVALLAAAAVALRWSELNRAVIVGQEPVAHIAPAENAASAFKVKPGEIVQMEGQHGDYVRIRIGNGRSAWIANRDVERIIPRNAPPV